MADEGVLGIEYHRQRQTRRSYAYRLRRRGVELLRAIQTYRPTAQRLLDIGTADGMTNSVIREAMPSLEIVGLDRSMDLLKVGDRTCFSPLLADATQLPFPANSFDVVSAAAVIEHLRHPQRMLEECWRVLHWSGICILTTPDPFFEHLATSLGLLDGEQHSETFDLACLTSMLSQVGFDVVEAKRFMLPLDLPCGNHIELFLERVGLSVTFLNQVVIGQRSSGSKQQIIPKCY